MAHPDPRGGVQLAAPGDARDRKSTRLNSSHGYISYAVFCLKKKKHNAHSILRFQRLHEQSSRTHDFAEVCQIIITSGVGDLLFLAINDHARVLADGVGVLVE